MTDRQFAALLGFAFVAAWAGFNLGIALLCLLGAAAGWLALGVRDGSIDLGEVQERFSSSTRPDRGPSAPRAR
jgi:hypothetical protein